MCELNKIFMMPKSLVQLHARIVILSYIGRMLKGATRQYQHEYS